MHTNNTNSDMQSLTDPASDPEARGADAAMNGTGPKISARTSLGASLAACAALLALALSSDLPDVAGIESHDIDTLASASTSETAAAAARAAADAAPAERPGGTRPDNGIVDAVIAGVAGRPARSEPAVASPVAGAAAVPRGKAAGALPLAAPARAKMSGAVARLAETGGDGMVELVVRYDEQPELYERDRIGSLGGEVIRTYAVLRMRAVRVPADALEAFAVDDNVARLSLDEDVSATSVSSRAAANLPQPASGNVAFDGAGVGVAILDTGIAEHADLPAYVRQ